MMRTILQEWIKNLLPKLRATSLISVSYNW